MSFDYNNALIKILENHKNAEQMCEILNSIDLLDDFLGNYTKEYSNYHITKYTDYNTIFDYLISKFNNKPLSPYLSFKPNLTDNSPLGYTIYCSNSFDSLNNYTAIFTYSYSNGESTINELESASEYLSCFEIDKLHVYLMRFTNIIKEIHPKSGYLRFEYIQEDSND